LVLLDDVIEWPTLPMDLRTGDIAGIPMQRRRPRNSGRRTRAAREAAEKVARLQELPMRRNDEHAGHDRYTGADRHDDGPSRAWQEHGDRSR
jgi:hypothetical protein